VSSQIQISVMHIYGINPGGQHNRGVAILGWARPKSVFQVYSNNSL